MRGRPAPGPDALPLAGLRFRLVGPGKVGESLTAWLTAAGARLTAVTGSGSASGEGDDGGRAQRVESLYGSRRGASGETTEDLLLLAVPDPVLPQAVRQIAGADTDQPIARIVVHTSGSRGASVLAPLRARGAAVGCFHPLKAFPRPLPASSEALGTVFALDGDEVALELGERLAQALGGVPVHVPETARQLYHFAATLAAGGVVTLVALATAISEKLGLPPAIAHGYLELARGALARMDVEAPATAITGPVARGDGATVSAALEQLRRVHPEALPAALEISRETLRRIASASELSDEQERLRRTLEEDLGSSGELDPS